MRITRCLRFRNWRPGTCYQPVPLKQKEVLKEYTDSLTSAVKGNTAVLASELNVEPSAFRIIHRLLSANSEELRAVQSARAASSKQKSAPADDYAAFLRHLHAPAFSVEKVLGALQRLPGSDHRQQTLCIDASHLEVLISRSMAHPKLFTYISSLLAAAHLPQTARELVACIEGQYLRNERWRDSLAQSWPQILRSGDTNAFNGLLKLSLVAPCKDTQRLVQYHLQKRPNRFTLLVKMRYQKDCNASEIMREFQRHRFVVDTVTITAYIHSLIKSRNVRDHALAEGVFAKLTRLNSGVKHIVSHENQLANILLALDRVNALTGRYHEVPLYLDEKLFMRMYAHYYKKLQFGEAYRVLEGMALRGYLPSRFHLRKHMMRLTQQSDLEKLFYFCCDLNVAHPGFMSDSLAQYWAQHISKYMDYESAVALVAANREVAPPP